LKGRRVWVSSPTMLLDTIGKKYLLYFSIHPTDAAKKKDHKFKPMFTHNCFPPIFSWVMTTTTINIFMKQHDVPIDYFAQVQIVIIFKKKK